MKRIPYVILISLLFLSGCQSQPGSEDPTARVGSITDDVPEINIPETDIDFSQFSTLDARMQAWGLGKDKDENGSPQTRCSRIKSIKLMTPSLSGDRIKRSI